VVIWVSRMAWLASSSFVRVVLLAKKDSRVGWAWSSSSVLELEGGLRKEWEKMTAQVAKGMRETLRSFS